MDRSIFYKDWKFEVCIQQLNPTLWRTCRVLSGSIRIQLLRQLHDGPGKSVSALATIVGIGVSDASQELRRIQSRGLLKADRQGRHLIYRMEPDPQVPSAAPLLQALQSALSTLPPGRDADMIPIAAGLAHPRRIQIAQLLRQSPQSPMALRNATHIPLCPMNHHLNALKKGQWVQGNRNQLAFALPAHPLAQALAALLARE